MHLKTEYRNNRSETMKFRDSILNAKKDTCNRQIANVFGPSKIWSSSSNGIVPEKLEVCNYKIIVKYGGKYMKANQKMLQTNTGAGQATEAVKPMQPEELIEKELDVVRDKKGNIIRVVSNAQNFLQIFRNDPLLKGAICHNELSDATEIIREMESMACVRSLSLISSLTAVSTREVTSLWRSMKRT